MTVKSYLLGATVIASFALGCGLNRRPPASQTAKQHPQEGFPASAIQRLNDRSKALSSPPARLGTQRVQSVIAISKEWKPGEKITVAFQGGTTGLRQQIAGAIQPWTDAGGIQFDFGPDASSGKFREWSTTDRSYTAEVRIGFDEQGYWSFVGRDSIDNSVVKPGEESMNFAGFTDGLPQDWQGVVLHEFGHSLGFEHEHQNPMGTCDTEFRWDDDPGYTRTTDIYGQFVPDSHQRRPGIYTVLAGPPNKWSKDEIDFNLRKLPYSSDWRTSQFDNSSVMKYHFDEWMYVKGKDSVCYSEENDSLSAGDQKAALDTYPRSAPQIQMVVGEQVKALNDLLTFKGLPADTQHEYKKTIGDLRSNAVQ